MQRIELKMLKRNKGGATKESRKIKIKRTLMLEKRQINHRMFW